MLNSIAVERFERPAEKLQGGAYRTGRVAADFVIDGSALGPRVRRVSDLIPRLGWGTRQSQEEALGVLLLERPADFPDDRRALYVCPECGDFACGTVTAVVEREDDTVTWRDFRYETETDPPTGPDDLYDLGPYHFAWGEYRAVLQSAIGVGGLEAPPIQPNRRWWQKRLF